MSSYTEIFTLVEGQTEELFVKNILAPFLCHKDIYMTPVVLSKPGQKGGDIRFSRAIRDIGNFLKQRSNTYLTLLIDFYGIKQWPGLEEARSQPTPLQKANLFNEATKKKVVELFGDNAAEQRFIPYVAMHEFEALLFSNPSVLAEQLQVNEERVVAIISECGEAESINDSPDTAPSKRLKELSDRFKKTTTGINIAKKIGLECMRQECPIFNNWLTYIENIT